MKVLSFTQTLVSHASAVFFRDNAKSSPQRDAATVYSPPGTVIEMDDEEARDRIEQGLVVEWLPEVHGATAAAIAATMGQPRTLSNNSQPRASHG